MILPLDVRFQICKMRSLKERIAMREATLFAVILFSLHIQKIDMAEIDIISDSQFLTVNDTLVSRAAKFELGFFKLGSSKNMYLGIWYKKISVKTVVWVANRNRPLTSASTGLLKVVHPGNLVLMNNATELLWSSNTTSQFGNAIVNLDDNGNLVMMDRNHKKIIWQSFEYPTDTHLPGMHLGKDYARGVEWRLSSWKSSQDPAPGDFTWGVDTNGYPQFVIKQGDEIKFRAGPWNGQRFSGGSQLTQNMIFTYNMVINDNGVAYSYNLANPSVISRIALNSSGHLERSIWVEDSKKWQVFLAVPKDMCDSYKICGANGICSVENPQACSCLDETRFVPKSQKDWEISDWSHGCVRRTPLNCKNGSDGFIKYSNLKLPDTRTSCYNKTMSLMECEAICQKNCTCMAYATLDIRGDGSGCLLWFDDLVDIRYPQGKVGQDIYVRMSSSELVFRKEGGTNIKFILIGVIPGVLISLSAWFWYAWRKKHLSRLIKEGGSLYGGESHSEGLELPMCRFATVSKATDSFSPNKKIGEGGFGSVYKGMFENGQEIAVKRRSGESTQGYEEFKNEVICISKLQHRNLVKLIGWSIKRYENVLIYEYLPNGSLDTFIFDKPQSILLDWTKRFNIIKGIAGGLQYLHHDSRLRIIHRDLKASNILLDHDMNPKISDFGMARSFEGDETQANTERLVGTIGYMSPELLHGQVSTKSDVFSFGVLVLEILSGKRINIHTDLIEHAWRMHSEGRSMEFIDTTLAESSNPSEVLRSMEVGLTCVQENPEDRPDMSLVVPALHNDGILPTPKQPRFFMENDFVYTNFSSSSYPTSSTNDPFDA